MAEWKNAAERTGAARYRAEDSNGVNALELYRRAAEAEKNKNTPGDVSGGSGYTGEGKSGNVFQRGYGTLLDVANNVSRGAMGSVEGIVDFAMGLNAFNPGFLLVDALNGGAAKERLKEIIEYDATNHLFDWWERDVLSFTGDLIDMSYQTGKVGEVAKELEYGIGGMLPSVAASIATAGAASPTLASSLGTTVQGLAKAASMTTLGLGAAGQATQEAYKDGAGFYRGLAYGAAEGAKEVATEMMFDGPMEALYGKGFFDGVVRSFANTGGKQAAARTAGRLAKEFIGEGVEEAAGEAVEPLLQTIYKGKDAFDGVTVGSQAQAIGKSFMMGGLTSLAYTGTVGYGLSKAGIGYTGAEADVNDILADMEAQAVKRRNILVEQAPGWEKKLARVDKVARSLDAELERKVSSMGDSMREKVIKEFSLEKKLTPEGKLSETYIQAMSGQTGVDERYYSPGADVETIKKSAEAAGTKVFSGELTQDEADNYAKLRHAQDKLRKISGDTLSFALVDSLPDGEGGTYEGSYIKGDNVVLLPREVLTDAESAGETVGKLWLRKLLHETGHATDGTMSRKAMLALMGDDVLAGAFEKVKSAGYMTEAEMKRLMDAYTKEDADMSAEDARKMEMLNDEVLSFATEDVLATEHFMNRLVRSDRGAAERILNRVHDASERLRAAGDKVTRATFEKMRATEGAFLKAVEESGYRYENRKIVGGKDDEEEENKERRSKVQKTEREMNQSDISTQEYIDISFDKELFQRIKGVRGASKYKIISEYIKEKIGDEVVFSDGVRAKVDNSDRLHIANKSADKKTAEITAIDKLVKTATLYAIEENVVHNKFNYFRYYQAFVSFYGYRYPVYFNVGMTRNKDGYHLYDITHKIKDTAHRVNDVGRLREFRPENGISKENYSTLDEKGQEVSEEKTNKISTNSEKVVRKSKKPLDDGKAKMTLEDRIGEQKPRPMDFDERVMDETRREAEAREGAQEKRNRQVQTAAKADTSGKYTAGRVSDLAGVAYSLGEAERAVDRCVKLLKEMTDEPASALAAGIETKVKQSVSRVVAERLWERLNVARTEKEKRAVAEEVAELIISQTSVREIFSQEAVDSASERLEVLSSYLKKMNVDGFRSDIGADEDAIAIMRRWKVKKGEPGLSVDGVRADIEERLGTVIDADHPADVLRWMDEAYLHDRDMLKKSFEQFGTFMGEDFYKEVKSKLSEEIMNAIRQGGTMPSLREVMLGLDAAERRMENREKFYEARLEEKEAYVQKEKEKYRADAQARIRKVNEEAEKKLSGNRDFLNARIAEKEAYLQRRLAQMKEQVRQKVRDNNHKLSEQVDTQYYLNQAWYTAQNIRNWKTKAFEAASQAGTGNQEVLAALGALARVNYRGNTSVNGSRNAVRKVYTWYIRPETKELLGAKRADNGTLTDGGYYSSEIEQMLLDFAGTDEAKVTGAITKEQARNLCKILDYFRHVIENFHKVRVAGKMLDAKEYATQAREKLLSGVNSLSDRQLGLWRDKYLEDFIDPMSLMRYFDSYRKDGFMTTWLKDLRAAERKTDIYRYDMVKQLEAFDKEHRKYFKEAEDRVVQVGGRDVPLMVALYLHMALRREQAVPHLMKNGFAFKDKNGADVENSGLMPTADKKTTVEEMMRVASTVVSEINNQLTEEDIAFLSLADKLFNVDCRNLKRETDMRRLGYTNVEDGIYVPIRIYDKAVKADTGEYKVEVDRATNAGFNKSVVQGASNKLFAESLFDVLMRHIDGVARYAGLSEVIESFEVVMNIDTGDNAGDPQTVKRALDKVWGGRRLKGFDGKVNIRGAVAYMTQMIEDVQKIKIKDHATMADGIAEWLRGRAAQAVLGLNPKVWATQFSSLIAAGNILSPGYILRGIAMKSDAAEMDKYCRLAEIRNADGVAARSQTLVDGVTSKIAEKSMALIGKFDRMVIRSLWNSCLLEAAENMKMSINAEAVKVAAGERLMEVIYETQQNSQATEKSLAMRSKSTIAKILTMFSSDAMKLWGRQFDAYSAVRVINKRLAAETDAKKRAAIEQELQEAKGDLARATGTLLASSFYMAAIALIFRKVLAYDDDDTWENWSWNDLLTFFGDMLGTAVGGLPIIKEVISFMGSGYGLEEIGFQSFNDLLSATKSITETSMKVASGEAEGNDLLRSIRSLIFAVAKCNGIPLKNVQKYMRAIGYYATPDALYRLEAMYQDKSFSSDLAKAIESGDEERASMIAGLMLNERVDLASHADVRVEMARLLGEGHAVLPQSVGSSIIYEGEEYKLSARQKRAFSDTYNQASEAAQRMVQSAYYQSCSDEAKASAMRRLYDLYYNLGIEEVLGVDLESRAVLFSKAVPAEKLVCIAAQAAELEADVGRDGRVIAGSKKAKIQKYVQSLRMTAAQKYLVFAYLGYSAAGGERVVKSYIQSLKMKKTEKEALYRMAGYK